MRNNVKRAGVQALGKRIVHQKRKHQQQTRINYGPNAVALQGAQIARITEFSTQCLEIFSIAVPILVTKRLRKMLVQIRNDVIVIEQSVVHIQHEYHTIAYVHFAAFITVGLCQLLSAAISSSACFGPQLPGWQLWLFFTCMYKKGCHEFINLLKQKVSTTL